MARATNNSTESYCPLQLNNTNRSFSTSFKGAPPISRVERVNARIDQYNRCDLVSSEARVIVCLNGFSFIATDRHRGMERYEGPASRRGCTRIRFGARFMRCTVANNRSGNSAGIVPAGGVHSTPQTLSFASFVPARHRHYHCYHSPVVVERLQPARHTRNDDSTAGEGVKKKRNSRG